MTTRLKGEQLTGVRKTSAVSNRIWCCHGPGEMLGHRRALSTLGPDSRTLVHLRRSQREMEIRATQSRAAADAPRWLAMGQRATARDVSRLIPPYVGETGIMTANSGSGLGPLVASSKAACDTAPPSNVKSVMSSKRDEAMADKSDESHAACWNRQSSTGLVGQPGAIRLPEPAQYTTPAG
jgi:hypothetical protein